MILAMGVFYGGIAQVIAGIMEWKKNSTFGMTAFLSYGFFWLTLVGLIAFPKWMGIDAPSETAMGYYLLAWGMFTGLMFVATLRINRSLQAVFLSLTVLFVLLAFRDWAGDAPRSPRSPAGRASSWPSADLRLHRSGLERTVRPHRPAAGAVQASQTDAYCRRAWTRRGS